MPFMRAYNCIVILGTTASGKTNLACNLASNINGAIISADSRQVYKHLDIGTGKDLHEYSIDNKIIKHYCINVCEPSEQFYLHNFCDLLLNSFLEIQHNKQVPIICGGTGLYLDALQKDFSLTQVPENLDLRKNLETLTKEVLLIELNKFNKDNTAHVDRDSKKRIIRGIEIASYLKENKTIIKQPNLPYQPIYFGIKPNQKIIEQKIETRLIARLNNGLVEEAENLLSIGVTHDRLQQLGLEYKFLSFYLLNKISYSDLQTQLLQAIIKFSKRQLTWFKKMEKEGCRIHWNLTLEEILLNLK